MSTIQTKFLTVSLEEKFKFNKPQSNMAEYKF